MKPDPESLFLVYSGFLTSLKAYHYKTISGYRHKLVDQFISTLGEAVDKMLEVYQGVVSRRLIISEETLHISSITDDNIIDVINWYADETEMMDFQNSALNAEKDTVCQIIKQYAYLFTFT